MFDNCPEFVLTRPSWAFSTNFSPPLLLLRYSSVRMNALRLHLALLILLLSVIDVRAETKRERCFLSLNRTLRRTNNYVWTCRCPDNRGGTEAVGRVQVKAPLGRKDTRAQASATLRCAEQENRRLTQTCSQNARQWEHDALATLQKCLKAKPSSSDLKMRGKFTFSRANCKSQFLSYIGNEIGGVWLCVCPQTTYRVVIGRAQFLTNASPTDAMDEVRFLKSCTRQTTTQLKDVCRSVPGDFELLSLQILQVCCKRARVLSDAKFQCATAVPDDVSLFKDFFLS